MKTATFNVNSLRARMGIVSDWLKKESPDVLCLQETKVPDKEFPEKAFRNLGYHSVFRGESGRNGVAVLSKTPFQEVRIGFDAKGSEGDRLITATVLGIPIANTYVPQGVSRMSDFFREKLDWLQRLYYFFTVNFSPVKPLLWMGDFNIAPEPIDLYDPEFLIGHVCFNPDVQAVLDRFRQWGLADVFRLHHPEPAQYTFWDYQIKNAVQKKKGWRLDHIWATRPLARKSTRCRIDIGPRLKEKASDHTFVIAEFSL